MAPGGPPPEERGNRLARRAVVLFAVIVAIVVILVALDTDAVDDAVDDLSDEAPAETDDGSDPDGDNGDTGTGDPGGENGEDGDDPDQATVEADDLGAVGANAVAMLRAEVPRLVIEIAVQEGQSADDAAIDHLVAVLDREADKPGGIEVVRTSFASDRREWSPDDIRAVAEEHRTQWSDGDQTAAFVAYLRGSFEDDDVIGVALNASETALFPDRWAGLLEGLMASDRDVERAVLTHEIGHLLALVELAYDSEHDREHPDAPGHSQNEGSVMHPAVRSTAVAQVFEGPPPDDFDQADRDDLAFLRTGQR